MCPFGQSTFRDSPEEPPCFRAMVFDVCMLTLCVALKLIVVETLSPGMPAVMLIDSDVEKEFEKDWPVVCESLSAQVVLWWIV